MTYNSKKEDRTRKIIIVVSIGLFLFSLTKDCYCTTNQCSGSIGVLLIGWMGMSMGGGAALTWLANPLLISSWVMTYKNSKYSLALGFGATLLCFSFLLFDTVIDNEAGHYNKIIAYKLGYWLWTFSSLTMMFGNLYLSAQKGTQDKNGS